MPSAAAGTATTAASVACCAAILPGPKPSARWTPKPVSRRWTSAWAPAASIVPAATRATSENATSSEITMPGGLGEQDLHARAGDELQLAEPERHGARLGQGDVGLRRVVEPQQRRVRPHAPPQVERVDELLLGHVDAGGLGQRVGDVVGRDGDPGDLQPAETVGGERVADRDVPLARQPALDHDFADLAVAQVMTVDDPCSRGGRRAAR